MQKFSKGLMSGSTALMVLHLLSIKHMYGYEIVKELESRSQNAFTLKEGTLYPVLHGLERKYYVITKKGTGVLAQKKAEWRQFSKGVNTVIGEWSYAK